MATPSSHQLRTKRSGLIDERAGSPGLLLALLGQQAMRRLRQAHDAEDLSPRQFHILGLLHDRGPMSQGDLGATMDVDPSILVTLLNPVEDAGYLERTRDPADRRRHLVTLTAAGRRQLERSFKAQREAEDELLAGLSAAQREQLRELLLVLRESLAAEPSEAEHHAACE
jgi:DNA-binding MarR family transcriptional regulator